MEMNGVKRKVGVFIGGVAILLVALVLAALVYLKLTGLKTAMQELVLFETNRHYALTIGKAHVDLSSLSFTFDNLVITRNPDLPKTGVRQVRIAKLDLQVANLGAMFRTRKYDIRTLVIDEPQINIDNHQDSTRTKFHLGQQLVKLYPAVESVLKRFNIEHLKINRAALGVNNAPKAPLTLGLVDLLIEGWEETRLTENSQLQLKIGQQELKLAKAAFSFTAVEYNLRNRQLRLDSISFATVDSISNSNVEIFAQAVVLHKLGYKDLFDNQRLTFQKVTVLHPDIDLHLILKTNAADKKQETNEKEVVTRIIRQSVGECLVDTVAIHNAAVTTVLQKEADSTVIEVPNLNFTLYTFEITQQSETFITGTADIAFDKTSIELTDGMTLTCERLQFDRQSNLNFEDVEIFDVANNTLLIACRSLKLTDFHLLPLLFDQALLVESVSLENAIVNVPAENFFASSKSGKKKGLKLIDIKQVALKNVQINHSNAKVKVVANGVSMNMSKFTKTENSVLDYTFRDLSVAKVHIAMVAQNAELQLNALTFDGTAARLKAAQLIRGDLTLALTNIIAMQAQKIENYKDLVFDSWQTISVAEADIKGDLPEKSTIAKADTGLAKAPFSVADFSLKNVKANVSGKNMRASFSGRNLALRNLQVHDGDFTYRSLAGRLLEVALEYAEIKASVDSIQLALPGSIALANVVVLREDVRLTATTATIRQLKNIGSGWDVGKASFRNVAVTNAGRQFAVSDSVLAKHINFGNHKKPTVGFVEVFAPALNLADEQTTNATEKNKPTLAFLDQFKLVVIHPGVIALPNKTTLLFGKTVVAGHQRTFSCAYLRTEMPKFTLLVAGIALDKNQLVADTLSLKPSARWLKENPFSVPVLHATLFATQVSGYTLDSLLLAGKFTNLDVAVGSFYIHAKRDNSLPDAPYVEKYFSLSAMLNLPPYISLNTLTLAKGRIDVEQVSAATRKTGKIDITDVWANATFKPMKNGAQKVDFVGGGLLAGQGNVNITYTTFNPEIFILQARLTDFNLVNLNSMILPLQAIEIKSGFIEEYDFSITGNNREAVGEGTISYKNLHLTLYKKGIPEQKNLGSELLTLIADGLVLRNSKKNAPAKILVLRDKEKATFHLWVASAIQGALNGVRQGKSEKRK
jgi:hypothetical protein